MKPEDYLQSLKARVDSEDSIDFNPPKTKDGISIQVLWNSRFCNLFDGILPVQCLIERTTLDSTELMLDCIDQFFNQDQLTKTQLLNQLLKHALRNRKMLPILKRLFKSYPSQCFQDSQTEKSEDVFITTLLNDYFDLSIPDAMNKLILLYNELEPPYQEAFWKQYFSTHTFPRNVSFKISYHRGDSKIPDITYKNSAPVLIQLINALLKNTLIIDEGLCVLFALCVQNLLYSGEKDLFEFLSQLFVEDQNLLAFLITVSSHPDLLRILFNKLTLPQKKCLFGKVTSPDGENLFYKFFKCIQKEPPLCTSAPIIIRPQFDIFSTDELCKLLQNSGDSEYSLFHQIALVGDIETLFYLRKRLGDPQFSSLFFSRNESSPSAYDCLVGHSKFSTKLFEVLPSDSEHFDHLLDDICSSPFPLKRCASAMQGVIESLETSGLSLDASFIKICQRTQTLIQQHPHDDSFLKGLPLFSSAVEALSPASYQRLASQFLNIFLRPPYSILMIEMSVRFLDFGWHLNPKFVPEQPLMNQILTYWKTAFQNLNEQQIERGIMPYHEDFLETIQDLCSYLTSVDEKQNTIFPVSVLHNTIKLLHFIQNGETDIEKLFRSDKNTPDGIFSHSPDTLFILHCFTDNATLRFEILKQTYLLLKKGVIPYFVSEACMKKRIEHVFHTLSDSEIYTPPLQQITLDLFLTEHSFNEETRNSAKEQLLKIARGGDEGVLQSLIEIASRAEHKQESLLDLWQRTKHGKVPLAMAQFVYADNELLQFECFLKAAFATKKPETTALYEKIRALATQYKNNFDTISPFEQICIQYVVKNHLPETDSPQNFKLKSMYQDLIAAFDTCQMGGCLKIEMALLILSDMVHYKNRSEEIDLRNIHKQMMAVVLSLLDEATKELNFCLSKKPLGNQLLTQLILKTLNTLLTHPILKQLITLLETEGVEKSPHQTALKQLTVDRTQFETLKNTFEHLPIHEAEKSPAAPSSSIVYGALRQLLFPPPVSTSQAWQSTQNDVDNFTL